MDTPQIGAELDPKHKEMILQRTAKIPIMATMDLEVTDLKAGVCELRAPRRRSYDGIFNSFHGGLLMTVADSAAAFALLTLTGPDTRMTTTDMNIRFLAPCLTDLTVRARVIKLGRTLCPMAVNLYDADRNHLAVAQVNYFLLDR